MDGFTSQNLGNLVQGVGLGNSFVPCTPLAVLKILQNCIPNPDFMGKNQFESLIGGHSKTTLTKRGQVSTYFIKCQLMSTVGG